jgi:hypothetical protein
MRFMDSNMVLEERLWLWALAAGVQLSSLVILNRLSDEEPVRLQLLLTHATAPAIARQYR